MTICLTIYSASDIATIAPTAESSLLVEQHKPRLLSSFAGQSPPPTVSISANFTSVDLSDPQIQLIPSQAQTPDD